MDFYPCLIKKELPFGCLTNDILSRIAKDFDLVKYEQRKTIADQAMVYMELKTKYYLRFNKEYYNILN